MLLASPSLAFEGLGFLASGDPCTRSARPISPVTMDLWHARTCTSRIYCRKGCTSSALQLHAPAQVESNNVPLQGALNTGAAQCRTKRPDWRTQRTACAQVRSSSAAGNAPPTAAQTGRASALPPPPPCLPGRPSRLDRHSGRPPASVRLATATRMETVPGAVVPNPRCPRASEPAAGAPSRCGP